MFRSQWATVTATEIFTAILWVHNISILPIRVSNFCSDSKIAAIQLGSVPIVKVIFRVVAIAIGHHGRTFKLLQFSKVKTDNGIENEVHIMTWEGTDPSLSSVLLNSHTDVVPVFLVRLKFQSF